MLDYINLNSLLTDTISGSLVAAVTAVVGYLLFKQYAGKIAFTKRMNDYGFSQLSTGK